MVPELGRHGHGSLQAGVQWRGLLDDLGGKRSARPAGNHIQNKAGQEISFKEAGPVAPWGVGTGIDAAGRDGAQDERDGGAFYFHGVLFGI